jgi:hypothetical protein
MTQKVTDEAKLAVHYSTYRPTDACNKIYKIRITKSNSWYVSDPKRFGIKVPSVGSLLKQRNTIQHANRPHCRHQNVKILEDTKATSGNPPCCDYKAVESEPFPVSARSCLCLVCIMFTNVCLYFMFC